MKDVTKILKDRGFLGFVDDESWLTELAVKPVTVYVGFDPTSNSLHAGNLLTLMGLLHFQRAGHRPIALIGGGTGLIGDPSGKSEERNLLDAETIRENQKGIEKQLSRVLDASITRSNSAIFINNLDWISEISFVEFLRNVGKRFRVNEMINKESVKKRMESDEGISLTEFCYQTLQAYDFYQLNKQFDCTLQAGGMDQWGNIAAGIDLVRRMSGQRVHGLCFPLLTKADGSKFGKTEAGAVWLDREKTSPFQFYQFWVRSSDRDVIKYLKLFSLLELEQIAQLEQSVEKAPEKREAQKALAFEVTSLIHGTEEAQKAKEASEKLFSGDLTGATDELIKTIFPDVPSTEYPKERLSDGFSLVDLLAETNLCKSKGDARRQIKGGGIYINDNRCKDTEKIVKTDDLASDNFLILRRGKKNYHLVQFC